VLPLTELHEIISCYRCGGVRSPKLQCTSADRWAFWSHWPHLKPLKITVVHTHYTV